MKIWPSTERVNKVETELIKGSEGNPGRRSLGKLLNGRPLFNKLVNRSHCVNELSL